MAENRNQDEITIKELILKIQEYTKEIFRFWYIVLGFCILTVSFQIYQYTKEDTKYISKLRFVVEGQSGGGGGLSSLLGSFGIKKGGNVSPYKILEVGRSSRVVRKILSRKIDDNEYTANTIVSIFELDKKLSKTRPEFSNFRYSDALYGRDLSIEESLMLKKITGLLWGSERDRSKAVINISIDDDTGIFTIDTRSKDEELSFVLTKAVFEEIKQFFEEDVYQKQKQLAKILEFKADSLKSLRNSKIYELARFKDRNRNLIEKELLSRETILNQDQFAINAALAEVIKNKEISDVSLKDVQPLFMAIDTPFKPLSYDKPSLIKMLIFGFILGVFFSILLILLRKIYKDIMLQQEA